MDFVNRDVGKFKNADLMCSFCDRILKTGGEKLSDAEVRQPHNKLAYLWGVVANASAWCRGRRDVGGGGWGRGRRAVKRLFGVEHEMSLVKVFLSRL